MSLLLSIVGGALTALFLIYGSVALMYLGCVTLGVPFPLPQQQWRRDV